MGVGSFVRRIKGNRPTDPSPKQIAIVTYDYNNYGTKLQNYALKSAIDALGHTASTLRIWPRAHAFLIFAKLVVRGSLPLVVKKYLAFGDFSKKHLNLVTTTYRELPRVGTAFDAFVVGSDQVWNPRHLRKKRKDRDFHLLKFVESTRLRMAYAPSFGVTELLPAQVPLYDAVSSISPLSIREPSGERILRLLGLPGPIPVMPDPTFLLTRQEWDIFLRGHRCERPLKPYLVAYFLSEQPGSLWGLIRDYAERNGLAIVEIAGDVPRGGSRVPDPSEFVCLVRGSTALFTDSFHASVFSTIYEVPFSVVNRTDVSQFTRIENLLEQFELQMAAERTTDFATLFSSLDFGFARRRISELREIGTDYLREALD